MCKVWAVCICLACARRAWSSAYDILDVFPVTVKNVSSSLMSHSMLACLLRVALLPHCTAGVQLRNLTPEQLQAAQSTPGGLLQCLRQHTSMALSYSPLENRTRAGEEQATCRITPMAALNTAAQEC